MSTDLTDTGRPAAPDSHAPDTSLTGLVRGILDDAQKLIAQQIELVRVEIRDDFHKAVTSLTLVGVGAGLSLAGAIVLCFFAVYGLHAAFPALPDWAGFLIVGSLVLLSGATCLAIAVRRLMRMSPLPEQSLMALKENLQWPTNPK